MPAANSMRRQPTPTRAAASIGGSPATASRIGSSFEAFTKNPAAKHARTMAMERGVGRQPRSRSPGPYPARRMAITGTTSRSPILNPSAYFASEVSAVAPQRGCGHARSAHPTTTAAAT